MPPLGGPNVVGRGFYSHRASLCVTHCPSASINIRSVPISSLHSLRTHVGADSSTDSSADVFAVPGAHALAHSDADGAADATAYARPDAVADTRAVPDPDGGPDAGASHTRRMPRLRVGPHVSEKRAQLDHICAETKRAPAHI